MTADISQIKAFAAELRAAGSEIASESPKVVKRGAVNVKRDAQNLARGQVGAHLAGYPRTITFDVDTEAGVAEADIGPVPGRQGSFAGIIEFGSVNSGPKPHLIPAFEAESPRFDAAIDDMVAKVLGL